MIEVRRHWFGGTVLVSILGAVGCNAPQPVMPDGTRRVPVNSDARIEAFKTKAAETRRSATEDVRWTREVQSLKAEVAQLRAATIVLAADAEGKSQSPLARAAAARLASGQPSVTAALHAVPANSPVPAEIPPAAASSAPTLNESARPVTVTLQPDAGDTTATAPLRLVPVKAPADVSRVTPSAPSEAARNELPRPVPAKAADEPAVLAPSPAGPTPEPPATAVDKVPTPRIAPPKEAGTGLAETRTTGTQGASTATVVPVPEPVTLSPTSRLSPMPTAFRTEDLEPRRRVLVPPTTAQAATPERVSAPTDADRQFRIVSASIGFAFVPPQDSAPALVQAAAPEDSRRRSVRAST